MGLEFRAMTPEDSKGVNCIQKDAYEERFREEWSFLADKLRRCPEGCWMCVEDGKPIGYMFSHPGCLSSPPELNQMLDDGEADDCYFIHDIAVIHSHRHKSIAKRFLDYALKCAATKRHTIVAGVSVQGTRDSWHHLGFEPFSPPEELLNKIRKSYGDDASYIVRRVA